MFQRMYLCLPACKEGFVVGCRPIIGVDGAHLKGQFLGILLTAVGKDGNNNIFPIAWTVVEQVPWRVVQTTLLESSKSLQQGMESTKHINI